MMNFPLAGDYIDIHNHDASSAEGVFILNNLMAHEGIPPFYAEGMIFSMGIHPWFLNEDNHDQLLDFVKQNSLNPAIAAIGEAGFDKIRGPSMELQHRTFAEQAVISEETRKPLVVHCVRAWDELMAAHKKHKPEMPWLIHGFRGKKELAMQLVSRNMYISFWCDFIIRPEASVLVQSLPAERIFLETDGSGADIKKIYDKVSNDIGISVEELKDQILSNYYNLFKINGLTTE